MEKASARKGLVKELRAFARQTGVAQVRDDSSRTKVEAMFQSIIASAAADVKTEATKVFEKYQSSFTVELESLVVQSANAEPFRCGQRQAKTFTGCFSHIILISYLSAKRGNACFGNR